jgi:hypothetical protein
MVDFKKLRSSKTKISITDPIEIFRRFVGDMVYTLTSQG